MWDKIVKYTYRAHAGMQAMMFAVIFLKGDKPKWLSGGQHERLFQLTGAFMGSISIVSWMCSNKTNFLNENADIVALKTSVALACTATFLCMGPLRKNKPEQFETWNGAILGIFTAIILIDTAHQIYDFFNM
eukprot:CAMPEP_0197056376 /NCGR_PEP_ID=MMETSP1384-20130603/83622_1 /TAXON_ID=29189 /ORGANISM="Ammonia sp." /LENGTH=131 /DNA_ID=CAMNT_0042490331 /DNA_START=87 /DNA_END=482 /DNA_ORIENTATION=+